MCFVEQSRATECSSSHLECSCVVCIVAFAFACCTIVARMVLQLLCHETRFSVGVCFISEDLHHLLARVV